jgi:hypothetical protein
METPSPLASDRTDPVIILGENRIIRNQMIGGGVV